MKYQTSSAKDIAIVTEEKRRVDTRIQLGEKIEFLNTANDVLTEDQIACFK
jgi:hypothetical protein